ncbi:MAG: hypothetical protein Q4E53_05045 [Eubacteriales bacterium]|nr:hypothetical protein [Eubacteriales bacterium]
MKNKKSFAISFILLCLSLLSMLLCACGASDSQKQEASVERAAYKVILSGNQNPHDFNLLKERLDDYAGKGKYTLEKKEDIIELHFDESVCQEMGVEAFVEDYLCDCRGYSIGKMVSKNFLGISNYTSDFFELRKIQPSDIESMEMVNVQEEGEESEESSQAIAEETRDEIPVIDDLSSLENTYLEIIFTQQAQKEIKKLQTKYSDLVVARGTQNVLTKMDQDTLRIDCSQSSEMDKEYILYSMSHERLKAPYSYKIFYEDKEWKDGYYHFVFGPKNGYIPYLNEKNKMMEVFRSRLDELAMEYELSQNTDGILSLDIKGQVNEGLMSALCSNSYGIYDDQKIQVSDTSLTLETNLDQGKIMARFSDYYNDSFSKENYFMIGDFPIAKKILEEKPQGSMVFDQFCFSSGEYNTFTRDNPYARFLEKILTGEKLPYDIELTYYADDTGTGNSEIFELPLPDLTNREALQEEIRKKYPEASFNISYMYHRFSVKLHLDPEELKVEELARDLAAYTEFMDAKDRMTMIFYPCEPLMGEEQFRVRIGYYSFESNPENIPLKCNIYLNCHGGRMDDWKDAFYAAAREEGIFAEARKYENRYLEIDMDEGE